MRADLVLKAGILNTLVAGILITFIPVGLPGCGTGSALDEHPDFTDFDRLYLSQRPPLGQLHVIDLTGETYNRRLLAASLQGVINRTKARIFLLPGAAAEGGDPSNRPWEAEQEREAAQHWLDLYRTTYHIRPVWSGGLDDALKLFAKELSGYYLADEDQPWTINAATTLAARDGAIIALPSEVSMLQGAGLAQIENLSGKWETASACYRALYSEVYPQLAHRGAANISPTDYRNRDFLIQQGLLTIYSVPSLDDWQTIVDILNLLPVNQPLFGYIAKTGNDEFLAVRDLSKAGKYLVASDTTLNLSFHLAVVPDSPTVKPKPYGQPEPFVCPKEGLNVSISMSDGDNLVIPSNRYIWSTQWISSKRGEFPLGWSLSPALEVVAPAIHDYYLSTASENDELIGKLGLGYTHLSVYPDQDFILDRMFSWMERHGLQSFWILDQLVWDGNHPLWGAIAAARVNDVPKGVMLGNWGTSAKSFRSPEDLPVMMAANAYEDTPEMIAEHLLEMAALPDDQKPPVVMISAAIWYNSVEDLIKVLTPLKTQGINFLLPRDAFACIPPAGR